ncbi:hypothetical protein B0H14DRAFT_2602583 [Mycena olivaceomarginata]|nr:hypothetical protein B0H14DRAFT_2602583 [Mycena olivaceomarginata]
MTFWLGSVRLEDRRNEMQRSPVVGDELKKRARRCVEGDPIPGQTDESAPNVKKRKYQGEWMICRMNRELGKEQRKHLLGARGNGSGREKRVKQCHRTRETTSGQHAEARSRGSGRHRSRSKRVATRDVVQKKERKKRKGKEKREERRGRAESDSRPRSLRLRDRRDEVAKSQVVGDELKSVEGGEEELDESFEDDEVNASRRNQRDDRWRCRLEISNLHDVPLRLRVPLFLAFHSGGSRARLPELATSQHKLQMADTLEMATRRKREVTRRTGWSF